jgi:type III secretion system YscQ/HrcQ family protein
VLDMTEPPKDSQVRQASYINHLNAHFGWLEGVRGWFRAELGTVDIMRADLLALNLGDVLVVEGLTARPHRGEGGTARLKVGKGQLGWYDAEIIFHEGRFVAKIAGFQLGSEGSPVEENAPEGGEAEAQGGGGEGAALLNDIPLQISIELGRVAISAEELVSIQVGQVIELNRGPGEPVDLSVKGKVVARGELVEVEGQLGVRIISLAG